MKKFEEAFMELNNLEKVQWVLSRITYKPGWTLTADWDRYPFSSRPASSEYLDPDAVLFTIKTTVRDINREGHPEMPLSFHRSLSGYMLREMRLKDIIEGVIRRYVWHFEEHEMDEWLKFDGICIREPHPELKPEQRPLIPGQRITL